MTDTLLDVKTRILSRVNLASVIGEKIRLENSGGRLKGLCPFHNEKSPSFVLYGDSFYCFGCKKSGDAITFVREIEGLGFIDALRHLAGKYGIEAPELEAALSHRSGRRQEASLYAMMQAAQEFYTEQLRTPLGKTAVDYLVSRGFSPDNISAYGFGMTASESYGLVRHLRQKGFREDDMISCSLATGSTQSGRPLDFLRGRVTIPIRDQHGRVIGFGGRTMDGAQPKYLNSRETSLFDKGHTLFGFDSARTAMRNRGRAIVVEGYMDTLQLWQSGFTEAVACLGTAFTSAQLKLMKAATAQVVLLFDGDSAGQKATLSSVRVALSVPEIQVKAAVLPTGEDPDSFVRKHGAEALSKLLDTSVDLLDFAVRERLRAVPPLQVPEIVAKEFVPWLAQIPDRIQRSFLITKIAHLTGIDAGLIASQIPSETANKLQIRPLSGEVTDHAATPQKQDVKAAPVPPLDRASFDLFGHIYHAQPGEIDLPSVKSEITKKMDLGFEHTALLDEMIGFLQSGLAPAVQPPHAWHTVHPPGIQPLIDSLKRSAKAFACTNRRDRLKQLFVVIEQKKHKDLVAQLKSEMSRASRDPARRHEVTEILMTIQDLTRSARVT